MKFPIPHLPFRLLAAVLLAAMLAGWVIAVAASGKTAKARPLRSPTPSPSSLASAKPDHSPEPAPAHPNFLFVYLDDQRWDAMQFFQKLQGEKARFPWIKTPHIDRLAAQGVWCRNAFATDSLCSPSRASLLTGQYPHTHGVVNNQQALPPASVTYATLLRAAGYATGFVGKWHMGQQRERPGFDFSAGFLGQGEYYHCPFWVNGRPVPAADIGDRWVDDVSTDYALDFLKAHQAQPFVLAVAFKSVHGPPEPNAPDRALYQGESPRPAPNLGVPASFQLPFGPKPYPPNPRNVVPYMECLAGADRDLGRLLDALDALKLSQKTMVIFAGDNGFVFGEHELRGKRSAYEESMRIPFLVRAPFIAGAAGRVADGTVLNIDVAPTLLDYASLPVPQTMQGRSLRPLLEAKNTAPAMPAMPTMPAALVYPSAAPVSSSSGDASAFAVAAPPAGWERPFLYEHFFEKHILMPTMLAVRTEDAKLIDYPGHPEWTELFRLDVDPYETANLAGKPEAKALQSRMEGELARLRAESGYRVPENSDPDTYVEDAKEDMGWRSNFPARPMSLHSHLTPAGEGE